MAGCKKHVWDQFADGRVIVWEEEDAREEAEAAEAEDARLLALKQERKRLCEQEAQLRTQHARLDEERALLDEERARLDAEEQQLNSAQERLRVLLEFNARRRG